MCSASTSMACGRQWNTTIELLRALMFRRRPIRRTRGGRYVISLGVEERSLLKILPEQLRTILVNTEDPGLRRLFPPAYSARTDDEHQQEFRRLMTEDLLARHREALDVLESTAELDEVTAEQLDGWMRALNSIRLVLGTRLDVTEDDDPAGHMTDEHAIYYFLGYLQECVIEALSGEE
jgi:Domain of unknown function (DUF2017)